MTKHRKNYGGGGTVTLSSALCTMLTERGRWHGAEYPEGNGNRCKAAVGKWKCACRISCTNGPAGSLPLAISSCSFPTRHSGGYYPEHERMVGIYGGGRELPPHGVPGKCTGIRAYHTGLFQRRGWCKVLCMLYRKQHDFHNKWNPDADLWGSVLSIARKAVA